MIRSETTPYSSINKWFLYPFIVWCLLGGIAILTFDEEFLFAFFNTHHTPILDIAMVFITRMGEGVFGGIVLLVLVALRGFRNWWYFTAAILCNVLPAVLTQVIKSWIDAPRPMSVYKDADWIHHLPEWETLLSRSFPSGHTCAAFCLYAFLAFVLTPKYKWYGTIFFALALLVGYSRMYLAAHFFLDVYIGSIFGVFFTILVVSLMKRYNHYFLKNSNRI
jgi:membrane-associated phospholipid phosphatase